MNRSLSSIKHVFRSLIFVVSRQKAHGTIDLKLNIGRVPFGMEIGDKIVLTLTFWGAIGASGGNSASLTGSIPYGDRSKNVLTSWTVA